MENPFGLSRQVSFNLVNIQELHWRNLPWGSSIFKLCKRRSRWNLHRKPRGSNWRGEWKFWPKRYTKNDA